MIRTTTATPAAWGPISSTRRIAASKEIMAVACPLVIQHPPVIAAALTAVASARHCHRSSVARPAWVIRTSVSWTGRPPAEMGSIVEITSPRVDQSLDEGSEAVGKHECSGLAIG